MLAIIIKLALYAIDTKERAAVSYWLLCIRWLTRRANECVDQTPITNQVAVSRLNLD